jgi:hypothetical protein
MEHLTQCPTRYFYDGYLKHRTEKVGGHEDEVTVAMELKALFPDLVSNPPYSLTTFEAIPLLAMVAKKATVLHTVTK